MAHPDSTPARPASPGRFAILACLGLIAAELERAELEMVNGRLCPLGTTNAFSGFLLERYPGGSLQSRSGVSNGQLHGISEGWHTNGVLQVRETFAQGVSHGQRTKWHPNGVKFSETPVVAGKVEGIYRRWDAEGRLTEEVELRAGVADGRSRAFYPSGCLRLEARLRQGEVVTQTAWKDGEQPAPVVTAQAN